MTDGSALGGLLGAALSLYVIHEVLHDGRTGRRLGVVHARSKKHAVEILSKMKRLPPKIRVFHGKPVKVSNKKFKEMGLKHLRNQYPEYNLQMTNKSKKKEKHYAQRPKTNRRENDFGFDANVKMPRLF